MKGFELTYKPFGAHSILIEWPQFIDEKLLQNILSFKTTILANNNHSIKHLNNAYASLLVVYKKDDFDFNAEVLLLKRIYSTLGLQKKNVEKLWHIPVCYHDAFGIDLRALSIEKKISKERIIQKHSAVIYTVYFIGFLPGFLYLGGLDKTLHTPRKETPRLAIEKGAVAIGGNQTGIYPSASPGGWHIIGNSPINFFDVTKSAPCFAKAGDKIIFKEVSIQEYENIKVLVESEVYQLESEFI